MNNIKKNLNYIGLALVFMALLSWRIWPYKKALPLILAILGVLTLGIYIFSNLMLFLIILFMMEKFWTIFHCLNTIY